MTSGRVRNLRSALKEKKHTWNKSCKESVKRESELYEMVEIAAIDERQEDKEKSMLKVTLKKLLEEMQQNLEKHTPELLKLNGKCAKNSVSTSFVGKRIVASARHDG